VAVAFTCQSLLMNGLHCMLVFLLRGPRVSQVDIMHLHRPLFLFPRSLSLMGAATGFANMAHA